MENLSTNHQTPIFLKKFVYKCANFLYTDDHAQHYEKIRAYNIKPKIFKIQ